MHTILVVLGKNWRRSPFGLSLESKMSAIAAGQLCAQGVVDTVVFSGGRTAGPDRPSEAEAMVAFARRFFGPDRMPEQAVILEEQSYDTASNAASIRDVLARIGAGDVILLTVGFHLPASQRLFANYGIAVRAAVASEEVLRRRSPHHASFVRRYRRSSRARVERSRELVRRFLLRHDPMGRRLTPLTRLLRHVDE